MYAERKDSLFVNLFINSTASVDIANQTISIRQQSGYPWDGGVKLTLSGSFDLDAVLLIRIPGWARNEPVPGDLYAYVQPPSLPKPTILVNGTVTEYMMSRGYAVLNRSWQPGDVVVLNLPMPVQKVVAHELVGENHGRIAIERGPLVYCAEGIDNNGRALNLSINEETDFQPEHKPDLLNGATVLRSSETLLVPYHLWAHRGSGEMQVWFQSQ
jgi:DUF1680 family protein